MRKRHVKKLFRGGPDRLRPYGVDRASGSPRMRRGRRSILRRCPGLRDRSSVPLQLRVLTRLRELDEVSW